MKGIEHFREAEKIIEVARERRDLTEEERLSLVGAAQVHAILAAATSISNLVTVWGDIAAMMRADAELADAESPRAEPLVQCNAGPADDGPERCHLALGHDGLHEHEYGFGRTVSWSTPAEMAAICRDCGQPANSHPPMARPYVNEDAAHNHSVGAAPAHSIYESTATDMHMEMPR